MGIDWATAFTRTRNVKELLADIENPNTGGLKKCLGRWDVVAYGVSSTVGAGIFVITGTGALAAGPAIVLSFLVASVCCLCSAFCYAEFASRVPVSGSAYTFTYVCMGELAAWFVGWNLTLEYAISAAAVARGWSDNFHLFWTQVGLRPPDWLNRVDIGITILSPFALLICLLCTAALIWGAKESATLNKGVTVMNVSCIVFIIVLGSFHVDRSHWTMDSGPDKPSDCDGSGSGFVPCGFNGILTGAVKVFFSYIGFDAVTTLAEEVKNPRKDVPFGIVMTLILSASLYVGASIAVTGMQPWFDLDPNTPLATAFKSVGLEWAATLIATVTVTALSVTTLCSLFGQPRIFYRMAKDGLLFSWFATTSKKTQVPVWGTLFSGVCAGLIAFCMDINTLSDMISMGTLMAFSTVCGGIVMLRVHHPTRPRAVVWLLLVFAVCSAGLGLGLRHLGQVPVWGVCLLLVAALIPAVMLGLLPRTEATASYLCPFVPWMPLFGIFSNIYLIVSNTVFSYYRILVWTAIGMLIYFAYGVRNSTCGAERNLEVRTDFVPQHVEESDTDSTLINGPSDRDPLLR
eukprot:m.134512 g.134512  ORF g.134512 m.134512 type:complete len:574 (+) comp20137_c0_seq1:127-1848(+)